MYEIECDAAVSWLPVFAGVYLKRRLHGSDQSKIIVSAYWPQQPPFPDKGTELGELTITLRSDPVYYNRPVGLAHKGRSADPEPREGDKRG